MHVNLSRYRFPLRISAVLLNMSCGFTD